MTDSKISFQVQGLKRWELKVGAAGIQFSMQMRDLNEEKRQAQEVFQNLAKAAPCPTTFSWSSEWPESGGGKV